jgi:hypothetical protein
MAATRSHEGGCLCGAVRYQAEGPLRPVVMCHCTQCRRMTGHFLAATAAKRAGFSIGNPAAVAWYEASDSARRGFCRHCGSTLFWDGHGHDYISIAAGSLDDSTGLSAACHIFVADKGDYYAIADGLPQIEGGDFAVDFPPS